MDRRKGPALQGAALRHGTPVPVPSTELHTPNQGSNTQSSRPGGKRACHCYMGSKGNWSWDLKAKSNFLSKSKLQKSTSTTYPEGKVIQGQKALLSKKTARGISRTDSREEARLRPAPTLLGGAALQTHTDRTEPLPASCPRTAALRPRCWLPPRSLLPHTALGQIPLCLSGPC